MGYSLKGIGSIGRSKLLWKDQPVIEARKGSKDPNPDIDHDYDQEISSPMGNFGARV
jgi:hypothetical protein